MSEVDQKQLDEQLCAAVEAGENDQIEKLIKYGANVHHQLDESDYRGSILNIAIEKDNLEVVKTLLRHKANPNGFPGIPLMPLFMCIMGKSKNCLEIAKILLTHEAQVNFRDERFDGLSPLHYAASEGRLDIAKLLLKYDADINAINNNNKTPLDCVNICMELDLVDIFLKHGGKANRQGFYTELLNEAIQEEDLYLIKCSLQNGADVNVVVIHASTPLFYCFYDQENMDAVKLIVDQIAKLEAAGLYVSPKDLELKNKLKDPLCQEYNSDIASSYEESFKKCIKEINKLGRENKPLYDFLQEGNINELVSIWEKNENLRNEFNDPASLKKQCPEYAGILINKANDVKKEIFLHNHAPSIPALKTHYGCDFQEMTFPEIKIFFQAHRDDFKKDLGGGGITLFNFIKYKDVEVRHAPTLKTPTMD